VCARYWRRCCYAAAATAASGIAVASVRARRDWTRSVAPPVATSAAALAAWRARLALVAGATGAVSVNSPVATPPASGIPADLSARILRLYKASKALALRLALPS